MLIGVCGGLAEIAFISIYMITEGRPPAVIAKTVAEAFALGPSASAGIVAHMMLSLLLGIGLTSVWTSVRGPSPKATAPYLFMTAALIVIWSFNFLVLLPSLSPGFSDLVPYPVSLAATLLFALAGAPVLRHAGGHDKAFFDRSVVHSPWTRF
jgi:hypothetical protein